MKKSVVRLFFLRHINFLTEPFEFAIMADEPKETVINPTAVAASTVAEESVLINKLKSEIQGLKELLASRDAEIVELKSQLVITLDSYTIFYQIHIIIYIYICLMSLLS